MIPSPLLGSPEFISTLGSYAPTSSRSLQDLDDLEHWDALATPLPGSLRPLTAGRGSDSNSLSSMSPVYCFLTTGDFRTVTGYA